MNTAKATISRIWLSPPATTAGAPLGRALAMAANRVVGAPMTAYYGARQIVRCNTVLTVFGGVGGIMVV